MNIWWKTGLAAASGMACWLVFRFNLRLADSRSLGLELLLAGLPGLLFSAGVLFPYLRRNRWVVYRASALVVVSSLSYMAAVRVAAGFDSGFITNVPGVQDFVCGSIAGAVIVLIGARLIIPLHHSYQLLLAGIPAAIGGGLVFAAPPVWGTKEDAFVLAYVAWHVLLACAIHIGERADWRVRSADSSSPNVDR